MAHNVPENFRRCLMAMMKESPEYETYKGCGNCDGFCSVLTTEESVQNLIESRKVGVFRQSYSLLDSWASKGCLLAKLIVWAFERRRELVQHLDNFVEGIEGGASRVIPLISSHRGSEVVWPPQYRERERLLEIYLERADGYHSQDIRLLSLYDGSDHLLYLAIYTGPGNVHDSNTPLRLTNVHG